MDVAADAVQAASAAGARPAPAARRRWPRWVAAALLVLLSAAGFLTYRYSLRDRYFKPRAFAVVEPGKVYRSGQISAPLVRETLTKNGIKSLVVMMGDDPNEPDWRAEKRTADELGIVRNHCPLAGDGTGRWERYADALQHVAEAELAGRPVLIHCVTGTQRTGGAVALYRVLLQGRPAGEAYRELVAAGHDPDDNPDLVPFLNAHMAEIAGELVRRGVLKKVPDPVPVLKP
ncbi:MAG TPA: tyrosine-protein phosphatase [Humisphaera sp.]